MTDTTPTPNYEYAESTVHTVAHKTMTVNLKVVKNSKGYGWEVSVHDAPSTEEGMALLNATEAAIRTKYGDME